MLLWMWMSPRLWTSLMRSPASTWAPLGPVWAGVAGPVIAVGVVVTAEMEDAARMVPEDLVRAAARVEHRLFSLKQKKREIKEDQVL